MNRTLLNLVHDDASRAAPMLSFSLSDALPSQRRTRPLQPAFYDLLDQEPELAELALEEVESAWAPTERLALL